MTARRNSRRRRTRRSGLLGHVLTALGALFLGWLTVTALTPLAGNAGLLAAVAVAGFVFGRRVRLPRLRSPIARPVRRRYR